MGLYQRHLDSIANYLFCVNPKQNTSNTCLSIQVAREVNALCKDGSMFVNIGLIAQASSEAEIAGVIP